MLPSELKARFRRDGGDRRKPYWYLCGPMTNLPQHNFPRFQEVAAKLRRVGNNIVSPAELDSPLHDEIMKGDGTQPHLTSYSETGLSLLRRDVDIVTHPNCIGVICLEGWENSFGANVETFNAKAFKKETVLYTDVEDTFTLTPFDRDEVLEAHIKSLKKQINEYQFAWEVAGGDPYSPIKRGPA